MELGIFEISRTNEGTLGVVSRVVHLLKGHPEYFIREEFVEGYLWPYVVWTAGLVVGGERLKVNIEKSLKEQDVEIRFSDFDLLPGTPIGRGKYAYRVNVFGGKTAGQYKGSIGFAISKPAFIFSGSEGEAVVSDNWTETTTPADEINSLIDRGQFFKPGK